ncbi:hypothetical protein ACU4HD_04745 [Cupriavidus basilensis]
MEQNIWLAMSGGKGIKEPDAVSQLLSMVNLAGFEKRMPDSLSGGATPASCSSPGVWPGRQEVLLLDEPFSAV